MYLPVDHLIRRALPLLLLLSATAGAETLSGSWQCNGNDGNHSLTFQNNSTLLYDNEPSPYMVMGSVLLVQDDYGVSNYNYQFQGKQLKIQFPDGSLLTCQRGSAPAKPKQATTATPSSGGVDSATLQAQIAGTWWGYSGSTERKIGLCPDGRYMDFTESGYSGHGYDSGGSETYAWGAASQGGNQGRWTIQGDYQQGNISVQTNNGGSFNLHYNQIGDPGCLNINGSRLCRSSARCE